MLYSSFSLVIYFTQDSIYMWVLLSQFVTPSSFPLDSTRPFSTFVSLKIIFKWKVKMSFYMKWFGSCTIQRSLRINWIVTTAKCEMFPKNRMTQEKLKWWKKWWKWCLLGLQKVILVSDCSHEIRRWLLLGRNVMTVSLLCAKHFLNTLYYFHSLEVGIIYINSLLYR